MDSVLPMVSRVHATPPIRAVGSPSAVVVGGAKGSTGLPGGVSTSAAEPATNARPPERTAQTGMVAKRTHHSSLSGGDHAFEGDDVLAGRLIEEDADNAAFLGRHLEHEGP